jgi:two-component system sensor histidine kinase KdpD
VEDLVAQALAEVRETTRVAVAVEPGLPLVAVDPVQVQRVLVNLLENALKFSDGEVEVRASSTEGTVRVDVLDRGPGLGEEPSTTRGLGLGLEIARGFAAVNHARLELTGRPGGGTCAGLVFA